MLGGTFDPVHLGHLELLLHAYEEFGLDRVIVIPTGHSYLKERKGREVTGPEHRLAMLELGIETLRPEVPVEISCCELKRQGPSYTLDTLRELQSDLGEAFIYWICGSDVLFSIEHWWRAEELLPEMILAVIPRGQEDLERIKVQKARLEQEMGAGVEIAAYRGREISSTVIRQDPEGNRELLPEPVYRYILEKGLYR